MNIYCFLVSSTIILYYIKLPKLCTFFTFRPVGWLGRLGWSDHKTLIGPKAPLACLNVYKSYIYVEFFHLETPYQVSTKLVKDCQSYPNFSMLAGWVVVVVCGSSIVKCPWLGQFRCQAIQQGLIG